MVKSEQLAVGGTRDGWPWTKWTCRQPVTTSTHISMRDECCHVDEGFWTQTKPTLGIIIDFGT